MSFAVVIEAMTLIAYFVIFVSGKQARETGWKLLSLLLMFVALVQCAAMELVVSSHPRPQGEDRAKERHVC